MGGTKLFVFGGINSKEAITNTLIVFYHLENLKGTVTPIKTLIDDKKPPKIREKNSKNTRQSVVGTPYNVVHKVHVNFDYQWTGQKPEEVFRLDEKLGNFSFYYFLLFLILFFFYL